MPTVPAQSIAIDQDSLTVNLAEGRSIIVPIVWYPRLWYGTTEERSHYEIIGDGMYLHWPDLDEDLSTAGILAGRRSGESQESLKRWLAQRSQ